MSKYHLIVNVHGGEISPYAEGLVSTDAYSISCRELTNWQVRKERGVERRKGFQFIHKSYSQDAGTDNISRFFGFQGSDQSYLMEFCIDTVSSRSVVRVYDSAGAIVNPQGAYGYTFLMPDTTATYAAPVWAWATGGDLFDAQIDQYKDDIYVVHRSYGICKISYNPASTPVFTVDGAATYPALEGNPFYLRDLDDAGQNAISSTSRMVLGTGYFDNGTNQILNLRNSDTVADVCRVELSGAANNNVCRPQWVGMNALGYTVRAGVNTLDVVVKLTQYIDDKHMIGVILDPSGGNHYPDFAAYGDTGSCRFAPPVLGCTAALSASSAGVSPFSDNDIGLSYWIDGGSYKITSKSSSTAAVVTCVRQNDNGRCGSAGDASVEADTAIPSSFRSWARPAWGFNTTATYTGALQTGWPGAITFFQGRMILAGSTLEPQTIWGSRTNFFLNFAPGPEDDEAYQYELASGISDDIRFVAGGTALFVGTKNGIYRITGGQSGITPTSVFARPEISFGADRIQPVRVGSSFYYVQKGGLIIRLFAYNDSIGSLVSEDVTELAGHVTGSGVLQLASESYLQTRLYGVTADGRLIVGSVFTDPTKPAWSQFITYNRTSSTASTEAVIESVATVKTDTGDQIWCLVKRTVNGSTVRYVERMSDSRYLDCSYDLGDISSAGGSITGTATGLQISGITTLTGQYLTANLANGETVGITGANPMTVPLTYRSSTVTPSATSGVITVTFNGSDATSSLVGETIILSGGGAITLTGYTNATTMTGAVITGLTDTSASQWQLVTPMCIGIAYDSIITPHRPEIQGRDGTQQGRRKKVSNLTCRVVDTPVLYAKAYTDLVAGNKEPFTFRRTNQGIGSGPTAYTGDVQNSIGSSMDTDGCVQIFSDSSYYAAVTLIKYAIEFTDGGPSNG